MFIVTFLAMLCFAGHVFSYNNRIHLPTMILGQGIDGQKKIVVGTCMKSCLQNKPSNNSTYCKYVNVSEGSVGLSIHMDQSKLKRNLGLSADIVLRGTTGQLSLDLQFLKSSSNDAFSITYIYKSSMTLGRKRLFNPELREVFEKMRKNGQIKKLKRSCGDRFVHEITFGAELYVSLRLSFTSTKQKRKFKAKIGAHASLNSIKLALENKKDHFSQSTRVSISARQIGGNVTHLPRIFGQKSDMIECTFGKFKSCEDALKSAINYSTGDFVEELKDRKKHAIIGYSTTTYDQSGIPIPQLPIPHILKVNRASINKIAQKMFHNIRTTRRLLDGQIPVRLSPRQKRSLQKVEQRVTGLLPKLEQYADICYNKPIKCGASMSVGLDRLSKRLRTLSIEKKTDIKPETLAQWCDLAEHADDPKLKRTLARLASLVRSRLVRGALERSGDSCAKIEEVLSLKRDGVYDFEVLDLSRAYAQKNARIAFKNLPKSEQKKWGTVGAYVNSYSQPLLDLRPLSSLKFLKKINLKDNNITSLLPLMGMKRLQWIDLRGNKRLKQLEPLKRLKTLVTILLDPVQRNCPVGLKNRKSGFFQPTKIACGMFHCCALSEEGKVQCWGYSGQGGLGINGPRFTSELETIKSNLKRIFPEKSARQSCIDENKILLNTSTPFLLDLNGVSDIVTGNVHTCVLKKDRTVHCWGGNQHGQLGRPGRKIRPIAYPVLMENASKFETLEGVSRLVVNGNTSCAQRNSGELWCWGEMHTNKASKVYTARKMFSYGKHIQTMASAPWGVCVVLSGEAKTVICSSFSAPAKKQKITMLENIKKIDVVGHKVCALSSSGQLFCWGIVTGKQLKMTKPQETNTGSRLKDFSLGHKHVCTLSTLGGVECWGDNTHQQLGMKSKKNTHQNPQTVPNTKNGLMLSSCGYQTCVLAKTAKKGYQVKCWGREGIYGKEGPQQYTPKPIGVWQR